MWLVHGPGSDKAPFEDTVLAYLREHGVEGRTVEDVAGDVGIGAGAFLLALASLEEKGIIEEEGVP